LQRRLLDLQEVGQDLAPGGAVDAELGYGPVPALQELVVLLQALEPAALERVALDVAAAALLDALLLGMGGARGQGHTAPVAGERLVDVVEVGVIEAGAGDTDPGVIEADHLWDPAERLQRVLLNPHEGHLLLAPDALLVAVAAAAQRHPHHP